MSGIGGSGFTPANRPPSHSGSRTAAGRTKSRKAPAALPNVNARRLLLPRPSNADTHLQPGISQPRLSATKGPGDKKRIRSRGSLEPNTAAPTVATAAQSNLLRRETKNVPRVPGYTFKTVQQRETRRSLPTNAMSTQAYDGASLWGPYFWRDGTLQRQFKQGVRGVLPNFGQFYAANTTAGASASANTTTTTGMSGSTSYGGWGGFEGKACGSVHQDYGAQSPFWDNSKKSITMLSSPTTNGISLGLPIPPLSMSSSGIGISNITPQILVANDVHNFPQLSGGVALDDIPRGKKRLGTHMLAPTPSFSANPHVNFTVDYSLANHHTTKPSAFSASPPYGGLHTQPKAVPATQFATPTFSLPDWSDPKSTMEKYGASNRSYNESVKLNTLNSKTEKPPKKGTSNGNKKTEPSNNLDAYTLYSFELLKGFEGFGLSANQFKSISDILWKQETNEVQEYYTNRAERGQLEEDHGHTTTSATTSGRLPASEEVFWPSFYHSAIALTTTTTTTTTTTATMAPTPSVGGTIFINYRSDDRLASARRQEATFSEITWPSCEEPDRSKGI
ncbi:hypothetical protein DFQ27_006268 [Actinomortierella ambigua]|uniref:Uncharacterized protein n=1 Tax=Actinomortierella ambigua TaxID=1343610 RepID=A0A9P6U1D0_9FUNG|nr:hypothetical protein DFQ27_006268 [Actinomortierella ambigua]